MKNRKSPHSDSDVEFLRDEFKLLQGSREALIDLNDRQVNFFLAMVSGATVLLTFISQQSNNLPNFATLAILFAVLLIGIMTFARTVEVDIGIATYARGLNRIRRYFVENNNDIAQYLVLPTNDSLPNFTSISFSRSGVLLIGLPNSIAVINSIVGAFLVGTLLQYAPRFSDPDVIIYSIFTALVTSLLHLVEQRRRRRHAEKTFVVLFPEPIVIKKQHTAKTKTAQNESSA